MAALEASMADLERSRADFQRKVLAVGAAVRQLQQDVVQGDAPVTAARDELWTELRKRRRLSGTEVPPAGQLPDWHVDINEEKRSFNEAVQEAERKLQGVSHAMACVHVTVQQARASVDTVKAEMTPLLGRLAVAREARNSSCSALLEMLGRSDADAAVLGELSVAMVWRLRGVSRAFRGWCGSALAAMPRVVAVGGLHEGEYIETVVATAISLDLATLAWGGGGMVPDLPDPRAEFSLGQLPEVGRLVVAGGISEINDDDGSIQTTAVFEWTPGHAAWTPLPPMRTTRAFPAAAVLSDGRVLVAGGFDGGEDDLASAEVLAADGSGWAAPAPMATARSNAVAGRLPGGQVVVAGGSNDDLGALASAELWDPATGAWVALPPMAQPRYAAAGCVLPSGRLAVLGGSGVEAHKREDAEAFDPVSRAWQPLPPMPHRLANGAAVAVAGGLLAVGGEDYAGAMLFDEESGRWFTLPGKMPVGREHYALAAVRAP
jgi:hypothetical protein